MIKRFAHFSLQARALGYITKTRKHNRPTTYRGGILCLRDFYTVPGRRPAKLRQALSIVQCVMPIHLPGHNYVGPGSWDFNKQPVDDDDRVARQHDLEYASAKNSEDVRAADRKAIVGFAEAGIQHPHAFIGAIGLGAKYAAESIVGVQYPRMPAIGKSKDAGVQRRRQELQDNRRAARGDILQQAVDETQIDEPIQVDEVAQSSGEGMAAMPQAGGSIPGGTGSSQVPIGVTARQDAVQTYTFTKSFQIYTAGFRFFIQSDNFLPENWNPILAHDPDSGGANNYISTSLFALQVDDPAWYMTPYEYEALPIFSFAKHCKIKIVPLGYRLPFATNESTSTYANSQTLVQVMCGVGLNRTFNTFESGYTTDPSDLTLVNGTAGPDKIATKLYGTDGSVGANMGVTRHLNRYMTLVMPNQPPTNVACPNLLERTTVYNVNDVKGTPLINFEHTWKNGMLKFLNVQQKHSMARGAQINVGRQRFGWEAWSRNPLTGGRGQASYGSTDLTVAPSLDTYNCVIEKSQYMRRINSNEDSAKCTPNVYFGVMPVQSNAALAPTPSFADVVVQWNVETEITIEYNPNCF